MNAFPRFADLDPVIVFLKVQVLTVFEETRRRTAVTVSPKGALTYRKQHLGFCVVLAGEQTAIVCSPDHKPALRMGIRLPFKTPGGKCVLPGKTL